MGIKMGQKCFFCNFLKKCETLWYPCAGIHQLQFDENCIGAALFSGLEVLKMPKVETDLS